MIIGVDFDDIIAETGPALVAFFNQELRAHVSIEEVVNYDLAVIFGITEQEVRNLIARFNALAHANLAPRPHAQLMIARLAQQHKLHIITNRSLEAANRTAAWLDQHFPNQFTDLHYCGTKEGRKAFRTKSSVCKHLRATLLLEDHPENALACARDGIHIYLFDQPWNRQEFPWPLKGIVTRVSCWRDRILETLLR